VYYCKRVNHPAPTGAVHPPIPAVTPIVADPPPDTTPPAQPRQPSATVSGLRIALTWPANSDSDLDHYAIQRRASDGSWPTVATSTAASWTDTAVESGTAYTYRVTAVDHAGNESTPSADASAEIAPAQPGQPTATPGEGQITVSWPANSDSDLDHYAVYRQASDGSWAAVGTSAATRWTDTAVQWGTTYTYRVTAVDGDGGESTASATASASPDDTTPPATPQQPLATAGEGQVTVSWPANTDTDLDHYTVYRQASDGSWPAVATSTTASWTDTAVQWGTTYTYRVTAVDRAGNESAPSPTASGSPNDTTPPAAPGQPLATPGDGQTSLDWPANTESDLDHYAIYRQAPDGSWPTTPLATNVTRPWFVDTGLQDGTAYAYRVTAIDHAGNESAPSSVAAATPGPVAPEDAGGPLFSSQSPWNQPLADNAPIDPNSELMMTGNDPSTGQPAFDSDGGLLSSAASGGTWLSYNSYSTPFYVVPANQPLVTVRVANPAPSGPVRIALDTVLSRGVPIPAYAQSAAGTDGQITIYQPSTDTLWDLFRACNPDGPNNPSNVSPQNCPPGPTTWTAAYGGVMQNVSQSLGYFDDASYPGFSSYAWGSTATSLPVVAGTATIAELESGHIDHALAINLPRSGGGAACEQVPPVPFIWPAQRSDGLSKLTDCIPEGTRLRLDPTLDVSGLPKLARMFAVAAQRYGMITRDRDAGGISFHAEDPLDLQRQGAKIDPYSGQPFGSKATPTTDSIFGGVPAWAQFKNFPWSHVYVLQGVACHQIGQTCPPGGD
jgi:fibronectin type 3 domain-containing protein